MGFPIPEVIVTPRLRVRLVEERDLPALLTVNGNDEVTRYLPYITWQTLADAAAWYARIGVARALGTTLQFVIAEKESDVAIGSCLLFRFEEASARAELGYVLGRGYWHSGYMNEALRAVIACGFGPLALRRIEAEVDVRNRPSARVLQKLGFMREGLLRERWVGKGEVKDVEIYGLLRHEWARVPAVPAGA